MLFKIFDIIFYVIVAGFFLYSTCPKIYWIDVVTTEYEIMCKDLQNKIYNVPYNGPILAYLVFYIITKLTYAFNVEYQLYLVNIYEAGINEERTRHDNEQKALLEAERDKVIQLVAYLKSRDEM